MGTSGYLTASVDFSKNTTQEQKDSYMKKLEEVYGYKIGWDDKEQTTFTVDGDRMQFLEWICEKITALSHEFTFVEGVNGGVYEDAGFGIDYDNDSIEPFGVLRLINKDDDEVDDYELNYDELEVYLKKLKEEKNLKDYEYLGNAIYIDVTEPKSIIEAKSILMKQIKYEDNFINIEWGYKPEWLTAEYAVFKFVDKDSELIQEGEIVIDEFEKYLKEIEDKIIASAYVGNQYYIETKETESIEKGFKILQEALKDNKDINVEIEWNYFPDWANLKDEEN